MTILSFHIETKGNSHMTDITNKVQSLISKSKEKEGCANLFVKGTTASLLINEYEPNLIKDIQEFFENILPKNKNYHHNDGNAHSHIRASLLKPSLTIPFQNNKLLLGTWQQIILIDFDIRPRTREVIIQIA